MKNRNRFLDSYKIGFVNTKSKSASVRTHENLHCETPALKKQEEIEREVREFLQITRYREPFPKIADATNESNEN